jgi:hypothetical protein
MRDSEREKVDGVIGLARETADALGRLTVQHLRLARLEIKADLRAMGLQAAIIAVLFVLGIVGYGLTMVGLAVFIGGGKAVGIPLLLIGSIHVAAAGIGILVALIRLRRMRLMNVTADQVNQSLVPLGMGTAAKASTDLTGGGR